MYLLFENLDQSDNLDIGFYALFDNFYWYILQLIVCLNPDFNCCSSFVLYWADN